MKNKLSKIITLSVILFSIFFLIQCCAVSGLPTQPMNFSKTSEKGLLVGSVTFSSNIPNYDRYFFRLTNNTPQEFEINRTKRGQLDQGRTYLFIVKRPVGISELPSVRLFHNNIVQKNALVGGFSIPYEIKKGEITYIGNITLNDYANKGDTVVGLKNKFESDIEALKKLQPSIDWTSVNNDHRKIAYNHNKAKVY